MLKVEGKASTRKSNGGYLGACFKSAGVWPKQRSMFGHVVMFDRFTRERRQYRVSPREHES